MSKYKFSNKPRRRDSRRAEMHEAVCDKCGKDCQVPFRPSGDKPIFCSDCFEKKGGRDRGSNRSRGGQDNMPELIKNIEVLNKKLEEIIDLLKTKKSKKGGK